MSTKPARRMEPPPQPNPPPHRIKSAAAINAGSLLSASPNAAMKASPIPATRKSSSSESIRAFFTRYRSSPRSYAMFSSP